MPDETLTRVSRGLLHATVATVAASRPIDRKTTRAALNAACDMVYRFGYGMTPTAVRMAAQDAVDAAGERPGGRQADIRAIRAWYAIVTADIKQRLTAL